jgi:hypothetical protein
VTPAPDGAEATRAEWPVAVELAGEAPGAVAAGVAAAELAEATGAETAVGAEPADGAEPPGTTELTIEDTGLAGAEPVEAGWLAEAEAAAEPD